MIAGRIIDSFLKKNGKTFALQQTIPLTEDLGKAIREMSYKMAELLLKEDGIQFEVKSTDDGLILISMRVRALVK